MGIHELIAVLLWGFLTASLILTVIGLRRRSWKLLWLAAGLSLVFSIAAGFSIGPLTFLLTCLQLAAVIASRRESGTKGWVLLLLAALLIWIVLVPVQIAGLQWLSWLLAFPVVVVIAAVATALSGSSSKT
jgi:hypothetical protein